MAEPSSGSAASRKWAEPDAVPVLHRTHADWVKNPPVRPSRKRAQSEGSREPIRNGVSTAGIAAWQCALSSNVGSRNRKGGHDKATESG